MAATTSTNAATPAAQDKTDPRRGRLLTPENTPGVDDGRIAADLARQAATSSQSGSNTAGTATDDLIHTPQKEIERILECQRDSYAEILGVEATSSEEEKLAAWRRLGCMIHPNHCKEDGAKTAFGKLHKSAAELGVDQPYIDEVQLWNGEDDLLNDQGDGSDGEASDAHMDEDPIPEPPARVVSVHAEATPLLYELGGNPDSPSVLSKLKALNDKIQAGNETHNAEVTGEEDRIPADQWLIPVSFFGPHYRVVLDAFDVLKQDPNDETARQRIDTEKNLIDELIKKHHFPAAWTIVTADRFVEQEAERAAAKAADQHLEALPNYVKYPWLTGKAADGSIIVGVRRQGRWGTQVCVEMAGDNGRIIRRLDSASDVGLLEVETYMASADYKNLAHGQSSWSSKDQPDFVELLWVTKSQSKCKNVASGVRDPPADCCVVFRSKGIQILNVSKLSKVLGVRSARSQIAQVCRRDGILPPWEAGFVSHYNDPSKVEKDFTRRRAMQDTQATKNLAQRDGTPSSTTRAQEATDKRIDDLQAVVIDLSKTVNSLASMFQEFMKASAGAQQAGA